MGPGCEGCCGYGKSPLERALHWCYQRHCPNLGMLLPAMRVNLTRTLERRLLIETLALKPMTQGCQVERRKTSTLYPQVMMASPHRETSNRGGSRETMGHPEDGEKVLGLRRSNPLVNSGVPCHCGWYKR